MKIERSPDMFLLSLLPIHNIGLNATGSYPIFTILLVHSSPIDTSI